MNLDTLVSKSLNLQKEFSKPIENSCKNVFLIFDETKMKRGKYKAEKKF